MTLPVKRSDNSPAEQHGQPWQYRQTRDVAQITEPSVWGVCSGGHSEAESGTYYPVRLLGDTAPKCPVKGCIHPLMIERRVVNPPQERLQVNAKQIEASDAN